MEYSGDIFAVNFSRSTAAISREFPIIRTVFRPSGVMGRSVNALE
jgi:hypothetical protein